MFPLILIVHNRDYNGGYFNPYQGLSVQGGTSQTVSFQAEYLLHFEDARPSREPPAQTFQLAWLGTKNLYINHKKNEFTTASRKLRKGLRPHRFGCPGQSHRNRSESHRSRSGELWPGRSLNGLNGRGLLRLGCPLGPSMGCSCTRVGRVRQGTHCTRSCTMPYFPGSGKSEAGIHGYGDLPRAARAVVRGDSKGVPPTVQVPHLCFLRQGARCPNVSGQPVLSTRIEVHHLDVVAVYGPTELHPTLALPLLKGHGLRGLHLELQLSTAFVGYHPQAPRRLGPPQAQQPPQRRRQRRALALKHPPQGRRSLS